MSAPLRAGNGFTEVLRALALNAQVGSLAHDPATRAELEAQLGSACAAARARGHRAVAARSRQLESLVLVDVARQRWDHSQPYMKDAKVTSGAAALHLHIQSQLVAAVREAVAGCAVSPPLTTSCLLLAALEQLVLPAASVASKLEAFYTGTVPSRARAGQYVMDIAALSFTVWCLVAQASELWCWLDPRIAALDMPLSFGAPIARGMRPAGLGGGASTAAGSETSGAAPAVDTTVDTASGAPAAGDLLSVLLLEPMCRSVADAIVALVLRTRTLLAHAAAHAAPAPLLAALPSALGASDCANGAASAADGGEGAGCVAWGREALRAGSLLPLFCMHPASDGRLTIEASPLTFGTVATFTATVERCPPTADACAVMQAEATSPQASGSASGSGPLAHGVGSAVPASTGTDRAGAAGSAGDVGSAGDGALPAIFRAPLFVQLLAELERQRCGGARGGRVPVPATHVLAAARGVSDCLRRLSGGLAISQAPAAQAVRAALQGLRGPGIAGEIESVAAAGAGAASTSGDVAHVASLHQVPLSAVAVFEHASPPATSHAEVWRQLFAAPSDAAPTMPTAPLAPPAVPLAAAATEMAADALPDWVPAGCGSWPLLPALVQCLPTQGERDVASASASAATSVAAVAARAEPGPSAAGSSSAAADLAQASLLAHSGPPMASAMHQGGIGSRSPPPAYSWLTLHELCICLSRRHELRDWDWPLLTPAESIARVLLQPVLADLRRLCLPGGAAADHDDRRSADGDDAGSGPA